MAAPCRFSQILWRSQICSIWGAHFLFLIKLKTNPATQGYTQDFGECVVKISLFAVDLGSSRFNKVFRAHFPQCKSDPSTRTPSAISVDQYKPPLGLLGQMRRDTIVFGDLFSEMNTVPSIFQTEK